MERPTENVNDPSKHVARLALGPIKTFSQPLMRAHESSLDNNRTSKQASISFSTTVNYKLQQISKGSNAKKVNFGYLTLRPREAVKVCSEK